MERSGLSTLGLRRCIRTWNEVDLVPLACEDTYAQNEVGLQRCIRTRNEVDLVPSPLACIRLWKEVELHVVPLACEDAFAYGTKWTYY